MMLTSGLVDYYEVLGVGDLPATELLGPASLSTSAAAEKLQQVSSSHGDQQPFEPLVLLNFGCSCSRRDVLVCAVAAW